MRWMYDRHVTLQDKRGLGVTGVRRSGLWLWWLVAGVWQGKKVEAGGTGMGVGGVERHGDVKG